MQNEQLINFMVDTFKFLIEQGEQSTADSCGCLYRFGHLKCAIGFHIPDELYIEDMEGKNCEAIFDDFSEVEEVIMKKYGLTVGDRRLFLDVATGLQEFHDAHQTFNIMKVERYCSWRLEQIWRDAYAQLVKAN